MDIQIELILSLYGEVFTELRPNQLRWATAQVLSRCFGQGDDIALLPFIDLCNHSCRADPPDGYATLCGCLRFFLFIYVCICVFMYLFIHSFICLVCLCVHAFKFTSIALNKLLVGSIFNPSRMCIDSVHSGTNTPTQEGR